MKWKRAVSIAGATGFFFWQLRHPVLLFAAPLLNSLLGYALALALPWLTVAAIFFLGRRWAKILGGVLSLPLLLYSFVWLLGLGLLGVGFDRFAETEWKGSSVRLYRTNHGAFTDFGVVVRQEREVFPGILVVRKLDDFYPCFSLGLVADEKAVLLRRGEPDCPGFPGRERVYPLKPLVYF
jgi:hypothetical protein